MNSGCPTNNIKSPLTIALDFDDTFTADPFLWTQFVCLAKGEGHTVIMITYRNFTENGKGNEDIETIKDKLNIPLIYTNRNQKEIVAIQAGYTVDIWIDDMPELIPTYNKMHGGI